MWSILRERIRSDGRDAFSEHIAERRSFFDPKRVMMRIARYTRRRLSRNQKFSQLGMSLVKLDAVCGKPSEELDRLFVVFVLMARQTDKQFDVPSLRDQFSFPLGIREIVELFGFVFFL